MKIAMIYGEMSTGTKIFDISRLYTEIGLTGSESSFFNLAQGLAKLGHHVTVYCACKNEGRDGEHLVIKKLSSVVDLQADEDTRAVICWNEPDYFAFAPAGAAKIMDQQLNDFGYCKTQWQPLTDTIVFPSKNHMEFIKASTGITVADCRVIPNSIDLELLPVEKRERRGKIVVYASSPDRGLHHLLDFWPDVRREVPDAELHVYYGVQKWVERTRLMPIDGHVDFARLGRRARYVEVSIERLTPLGVKVNGFVSNKRMLEVFSEASVLAYPCDPIRYTEGFGVTALDALATGCPVIISDADALEEAHGTVARVIRGKPGEQRRAWVDAIVEHLTKGSERREEEMEAHAARYSKERVASEWEALILEKVG